MKSRWLATYRRYRGPLLGASGVAILMLLWQAFAAINWMNPVLTGTPVGVLRAFLAEANSGRFLADLLVTLQVLGVGFGLCVLLGIPIGIFTGWYRVADHLLDPLIWFFYNAPTVAFFPVFMVVFGLGAPTILALTVLLGVFPIIVNTNTGVRQVDPVLIRAGRSYGANDLQLFYKVVLPASLRMVVAGLRLGFSRAVIGTIIGEFFAANHGLGFRITFYGVSSRVNPMMVYIITIALLGMVGTQLLRALESRLTVWNQ